MSNLNKAFDKAKLVAKANLNDEGRMSYDYTTCLGFLYLNGHLTDKEAEATENYLMKKNFDVNICLGLLKFNEVAGV